MLRNLFLCKAPLLLLIASVATAAAQTPVEINFGVISTQASTNQKKNWEPFLQSIAQSTGFKVSGFYATDYADVIEAMRFNNSPGSATNLAWKLPTVPSGNVSLKYQSVAATTLPHIMTM